jgi:hypothetical protein
LAVVFCRVLGFQTFFQTIHCTVRDCSWSISCYWGNFSLLRVSLMMLLWRWHWSLDVLKPEPAGGLPALTRRGLWMLYLQLLVPQTAFPAGLQLRFFSIGDVDAPVIFRPFGVCVVAVFLSLGDPWRSWDITIPRLSIWRTSMNGYWRCAYRCCAGT